MAYVLDTGAVLRLLALRRGDEFLRWIEQAGVRPFIAPVTMAAARDSYQGSPDLTAAQRATYEQRFAALLRDLGQGTEESVIAAELDFNGSRILSEIMAVVGFFVMLSGTLWGIWWRIEGKVEKAKLRELSLI